MKQKWVECRSHFTSEKSTWKNKTNTESIKALEDLIARTIHLFDHICVGIRTQLNECFHSMKGRYVNKRYAFSISWHTRIQLAILEFNWPGEWQLELAQMMGIEITEEQKIKITEMLDKRKIKRFKKKGR